MPKKLTNSRRKPSRRQERDIDIEISFMEGLVQRDPSYVEALQVLGDGYTKRGKFSDGLKVDEQLSKLKPDDAIVHYNLACSYSLVNRCELAAAALEQALNLGYGDFKWMSEDPDLHALRQHPSYRNIEARIRRVEDEIR